MLENPPAERRTVGTMALVGGRPVVDFVNTLSNRTTDPPRELLHSFDDLLEWCVREEMFGRTEAGRLAALARERPDQAAEALDCALRLREALFDLFTAQIENRDPPAEALATLNATLEEGLQKRRLEATDHGLCWTWAERPDRLDWILWPLAWQGAELLSSSEVARLKECGQDDCRWIFLDLSKNRSRRWCTMDECGNRAKARRHYARAKGRG